MIIGTVFTLFILPSVYLLLARNRSKMRHPELEPGDPSVRAARRAGPGWSVGGKLRSSSQAGGSRPEIAIHLPAATFLLPARFIPHHRSNPAAPNA